MTFRFLSYKNISNLNNKGIFNKEHLITKDIFCNFIYSNASENNIREDFFEYLGNKYKPVVSAGRYLNNTPDKKPLPKGGKIDFQKRCKFSIAFENTRLDGYCTEKILDAFYANTIPIYYGDPSVKEIFNPDAFINVSDYSDYDEVIEVIRRLDNDDDAYMKMLSAPMFTDPALPLGKYNELCEFLYNIFDREPEEACKWPRYYQAQYHNDRLLLLNKILKNKFLNLLFMVGSTFKASGIKGVGQKIIKTFRKRRSNR